MRYYSQEDFNDRRGRIWFNADKYDLNVASFDATLEPLEADFQSNPAVGDVEATLENFTCSIQAHQVSEGDIEATLQPLEFTSTAFIVNVELKATLQPLICEGWANMGIEAQLEYFSCEMQSLFGASIEASFEEIDLIADGNATLVKFQPLLEKLGIEMFTGVSLDLELEPFEYSSNAFVELKANLEGQTKKLLFEAYTGHHIIANFQPIGFTAVANTPVLGTLSLKTKNFTCSMAATTESVNTLLAALRQLTHRASAVQVNPGEETILIGTLKNLNATLVGINGPVADLEGSLLAFEAEFYGSDETENILTGILEELTLSMISFTGTGVDDTECEPHETLEFGVEKWNA